MTATTYGSTATTPHLVFELRGHLFAVRAGDVREVVRLPALEPLAEAPAHLAGVLNLRGELVPVVDLALRMGYDATPHDPSQAIVVLSHAGTATGVLVDRVEEFVDLREDQVQPAPEAPAGVVPSPDAVVRHVVRLGERIAVRLDLDDVLHELRPQDHERVGGELATHRFRVSEDAMPLLRRRAQELAQPVERDERAETPPLVLIKLAGETFAVPAAHALEFVGLDDLTPVPSCPRHIAGHASLRGDILVVLDVRHILGLDATGTRERLRAMLVPNRQGLPVAILVDEVLDVAEALDVQPVPEAARSSPFIRGSALMEGLRIPILDVARLVDAPEIIVREDV